MTGIWRSSCRRVRRDIPAAQAGQKVQVHPLHPRRHPIRDRRRQDLGRGGGGVDEDNLRRIFRGFTKGPMPLGSLRFRIRKRRDLEEQTVLYFVVSFTLNGEEGTLRGSTLGLDHCLTCGHSSSGPPTTLKSKTRCCLLPPERPSSRG